MHRIHVESINQSLRGLIGGAVIHDDDLIGFIGEVKQRFYGLHYRNLFIVCRNDDSNRDVVIIGQIILQLMLAVHFIKLRGAHHDRQE